MTEQINRPDLDDQKISDLVQSVRYKIPYPLDEKVTAAIIKPHYSPLWLRLSLSTAILTILVVAVFALQSYFKAATETVSPITEIKTQFELNDKNIKILWVHKKDFKLRRKEES